MIEVGAGKSGFLFVEALYEMGLEDELNWISQP